MDNKLDDSLLHAGVEAVKGRIESKLLHASPSEAIQLINLVIEAEMKTTNRKSLTSWLQRKLNEFKSSKFREEAESRYKALGYERDEVISALIKEMRLGNLKNALYWYYVMEKAKEDSVYVMRRLAIFAAEDGYDFLVVGIVSSCYAAMRAGIMDWNYPYRCVELLTKSKKFWEDENGRKYERFYHQVKETFENGERLPVPSYAIDVHTKRGKEILKSGGEIDSRYSGTLDGRKHMMEEYEKNGKLKETEKSR